LDCIDNMTIKCAWCGGPIRIGNPVTLYVPDSSFEIPDYAVTHVEGDRTALVGCLDWDCAATWGDMSGLWVPPGKVERIMSPIERCIHSIHEGNPTAVFVADTNDPRTISLRTMKR